MKISISYRLIIITLILCILKAFNIITISWAWCTILIWFPLLLIFIVAFFIITAIILYIIYCIIYDQFRS
jgi:hypothetical protein